MLFAALLLFAIKTYSFTYILLEGHWIAQDGDEKRRIKGKAKGEANRMWEITIYFPIIIHPSQITN